MSGDRDIKLGLIAVYLVKEHDEALLDLHLSQIDACATVPYQIYGAAHRLLDKFKPKLESHPRFTIVNAPPTELRLAKEHAYYLDQLTKAAFEDGCTHVCSMHVDSFPVKRGWDRQMLDQITEQNPLCAILRAENGDTMMPFAAGCMFSREFYEKYQPRFAYDMPVIQSEEFKQFITKYDDRIETGIHFGFLIDKHGLGWSKLLHSNRHSEHYLMAAIYGDLIFHLSAAARDEKGFAGDRRGKGRTFWFRAVGAFKNAIYPVLPSSGRRVVSRILPDQMEMLRKREEQNTRIFNNIREKLYADPQRYLAHLRAQAG